MSSRIHRSPKRRMAARMIITAAVAAPLALSAVAPASADAQQVDFSSFSSSPEAPAGEQGWKSAGSSSQYDWAVVANSSFPASGITSGSSLRFSNSVADNVLYGGQRQLSTPSLETAGTVGSGASEDTFDATFTIASTTGGLQPGLNMSLAADDGTGARGGGFVGFRHVTEGLQIWTTWLPEGGDVNSADSWRNDQVIVPADAPHSIRLVSHFEDSDPDSFSVYVDGELELNGHTWAEYHQAVDQTEAVANGLTWRTGPTAPGPNGLGYVSVYPTPEQNTALDGKGFLFTDLAYSTYSVAPSETPVLAPEPSSSPDAQIDAVDEAKAGGTVEVRIPGFLPNEDVHFAWYSEPVFGGWFKADAEGVVTATLTVPAGLPAGTHTLQAVGATSGFTANTTISVAAAPSAVTAPAALPDTGFAGGGLIWIAAIAVALGVAAMVFVSVRRRRSATSDRSR